MCIDFLGFMFGSIDWYKDHPADDTDAVVAPRFNIAGNFGRK